MKVKTSLKLAILSPYFSFQLLSKYTGGPDVKSFYLKKKKVQVVLREFKHKR